MISEVLLYRLMITCILIPLSSTEVKWTVRETSPKLGHDLTLFCKVDNCTVNEIRIWRGGPDNKVLMVNSGISTDKTKYNSSIEKHEIILTILNLTVKDLNVSYECSCGFHLDKHILYIDVYTVDNLNKSTNGSNYVGTNDGGGIYIYLYIAIPVILVIVLIIVIVIKRHWLWRKLKEKIYGPRRRNSDLDDNLHGNELLQQSQESINRVTDLDDNLHGNELLQQSQESINRVTVEVDSKNVTDPLLQNTHVDSNLTQSSDLDDNLHGNELLQQSQESINRVTGSSLPTDHIDSNQRQNLGNELLQQAQVSKAPGSSLPTAPIDSNQRQNSGSSLPTDHINSNQRQNLGSSLPTAPIDSNQRQNSGSSLPTDHIDSNQRQNLGSSFNIDFHRTQGSSLSSVQFNQKQSSVLSIASIHVDDKQSPDLASTTFHVDFHQTQCLATENLEPSTSGEASNATDGREIPKTNSHRLPSKPGRSSQYSNNHRDDPASTCPVEKPTKFKDIKSREESFNTLHLNISTVGELAEAGFYYLGYLNNVKCFSCGKRILWKEGQDPLNEEFHINCEHLRDTQHTAQMSNNTK